MDIGETVEAVTCGCQVSGFVLRTPVLTGVTLTMTTTSKAGRCMRATGITRIMAITMTTTITGTTKFLLSNGLTSDHYSV
jgi:hypothetical protein